MAGGSKQGAASLFEARYRQLVEHLDAGVFVSRLDGTLLEANKRLAEMTGYLSAKALLAASAPALYANSKGWQELVLALQSGHPISNAEALLRRTNGSNYWASLSAFLVVDDDGQPTIQAIVRDFDDRRRTEEALRESEALLRESQRVANIGHYVYDTATDRWTSSEALDTIFGLTAGREKDYALWLSLIHPDDQAMMQSHFQHEVLEHDLPFDKEYRVVRLDGKELTVHGLGKVQRDATGRPVKVFGTIQDITSKKQAEAAGHRLEEQLRHSQKLEAIGLLAGGVAHDLNNLLTPILGNAELLLLGRTLQVDQRGRVDQILQAGRRAQGLVAQLMAFGRKQALQIETLDLNQVIRDFCGLLRGTLREHIDVSLVLQASTPSVHVDRSQIEQVLMNLAVNAQDAMPHGGTLNIETQDVQLCHSAESAEGPNVAPGPYLRLTVSDSGGGIPMEARERIFDPFFTTKEKGKGTGLGLATVYGIVRQHGGDVRLRSKDGHGAIFEVFLPATKEPASRVPSQRPPSKLPVGQETILIAEDNQQARDSTRALVEYLGYVTVSGADVQEVIRAACEEGRHIDLLLTDVIMPSMDGVQLFELLSKHQPTLKVVYMSGYASDAIVRKGVLKEGIAFLQKPFSLRELAEKMREALDS